MSSRLHDDALCQRNLAKAHLKALAMTSFAYLAREPCVAYVSYIKKCFVRSGSTWLFSCYPQQICLLFFFKTWTHCINRAAPVWLGDVGNELTANSQSLTVQELIARPSWSR